MSIEEINAVLDESGLYDRVEPMDDEECYFWEWAETVGCVDDFIPEYF